VIDETDYWEEEEEDGILRLEREAGFVEVNI
jgi:hypothetical protein